MRRERIADLDCCLLGDGASDGDGPVVVLLHGFGAPGEDLVPLWRILEVPAGTRFVFPAAPLALDIPFSDARAWWPIDLVKMERAAAFGKPLDLSDAPQPGLPAARDKVLDLIEALAARGVPASRMILGGFSQGAMLACDVVLRTALPFAGLAMLSGTIVSEREWLPLLAARRGLPVFQSHGEYDPLLSYAAAQRLRSLFGAAGIPVEWVGFRGGHEIPNAALAGLGAFIATVSRKG